MNSSLRPKFLKLQCERPHWNKIYALRTKRSSFAAVSSQSTDEKQVVSLTRVAIDRNFLDVVFQPTVCIFYSLQSKAIHMAPSRDHSFQLPVCNFNFRCVSFILFSLYRFK